MDDLSFELPELAAELAGARTFEAVEAALGKAAKLTPRIRDPENFGRRLFTRGLDAGLDRIARALQLKAEPPPKSNDRVAIVASQFYATGGHTRVARDVAAGLGPNNRPLLILTNMGDGSVQYRGLMSGPGLKTPFDEDAFLVLQARTLIERILELYMMLKAARVSRIVLMCHPFDVVAITACRPFQAITDFLHHADHVPALGASLAWSGHVDLTYPCHRLCREAGVSAVYAGMTSTLTDAPPHARQPGRLRLATCGDQRKYVDPAPHRWADWAVAALALPGAEMRHIGVMSEDFQAQVHKALAEAGVDPARYVFTGMAPSLPAALVEHGPDVYVSSYPADGGKANLEAMLLGLPVVVPFDADAPELMRFTLPLKHYVTVADPADMAEALERALALGETLQSPDAAAARAREIARFTDFVAGRPLSPA